MARVRGNSRTAYDLRIKKNKEEKDAIKHGSSKLISTSKQGKKQYKYWDSNKRKYVSKENLTARKVKIKPKTQSGLTKAELDKKQKDINFRRRQGESSSRTDKGYQKPDTPSENKDTSTESNKDSSNNGGSDNKSSNKPYVDPDAADKKAEKNFRNSSSVEQAKEKSDPLRKYRRGGDTGRKETRITKKLKKVGFTSDRLAKLRKKNAEFQAAKKGGKAAMKKYREKYPKRG